MMHSALSLFFSLVVVLTLITPAQAQQWTGAMRLGGTVTTFDGDLDEATTWKGRSGLMGGIAVGYDLGNGFIPQVDFLYVRKGASGDTVLDDGTPLAIRSDITYLEIPVLLQYRLETNGYVHPKILAGPMLAFRLDARISSRVRGTSLEQTEADDTIEPRDYGAVAGAGIDVDMGGQRVSFEARAVLGRGDITIPRLDGSDPELRIRGLEFMIGILF